jgi:membrane glycosyltransferase
MYDVQGFADRDYNTRTDPDVALPAALSLHSRVTEAHESPKGLPCPYQSLTAPFRDPDAPAATVISSVEHGLAGRRIFAVAATLALTLALVIGTATITPPGLPAAAMAVVLILVAVAFLPIAQGVVLTIIGLSARNDSVDGTARDLPRPSALRVALLLPIHEEDPALVFGNAAAMLDDLARQTLRRVGGNHEFALFILSDTRSPDRIADEEQAIESLRRLSPPGIEVHYRRRAAPVDRKMGNIRDWMEARGADWPAMLVLDADSLMSGAAIVRLADALASDPSAGLIQTVPRILGAATVFARLQAFSHSAHGGPLAAGLAACAGDSGNYWGHNAILRTRAFAASAGLPHLPPLFPARDGKSAKGELILSHDFVEAALLRRAGWGVRIVPEIMDSYEEAPPTLIDHALRDRRWCRGNMQHLRIMAAPGLNAVSRVHLAMGAVAYLAAPAWLGLILFWVVCRVLAPGTATDPVSGTMTAIVVGFALAALVLPRLMALVPRVSSGRHHRAADVLAALALSALYAPILMVQQTLAVTRALLGLHQGWAAQNRHRADLSLGDVARFHRVETTLGLVLVAGIGGGAISPWLLAVAVPLILAIPLSLFGALPTKALPVPEDHEPPRILQQAEERRKAFRHQRREEVANIALAIAAE